MGSGFSAHKGKKTAEKEATEYCQNDNVDIEESIANKNENMSENENIESITEPITVNQLNCEETKNIEDNDFLVNAANVLDEVLPFFAPIEEPEIWGTKEGRIKSKKIAFLSINSNNKKLTRKKRQIVSQLFSKKNVPEFVKNHFEYAVLNMTDLFKKDEKILKEEFKSQREEASKGEEEKTNKVEEEKNTVVNVTLNVQNVLGNFLMMIINCSDVDVDFCFQCCSIGMVKTLIDSLTLYMPIISEEDKKDLTAMNIRENGRTRILSFIFSCLHNIGKYPVSRKYFEYSDCMGNLVPFLTAMTQIFSMKALLILSYLIDEENNHVIMANKDPIKLIISYLRSAIKSKNHRYLGFSLSELINGLRLIAQNDVNTQIIGENGGIDVIALALEFRPNDKEEEEKEVLESCKALWILSFHDNNRKLICENNVIMNHLQKIKGGNNTSLGKAAAGALWELEGKYERKVDIETNKTKGHIMISYQWTYQKTMLQVRDQLQSNGYKVWMDVDQMGGSTLEAMAKAVEGACLVVITVSRAYKESANCRSEAEYAFQLQRPIIPLMMENDYVADGWLGFIVGAKFWIDFKREENMGDSLEALLREIEAQINKDVAKADKQISVVESSLPLQQQQPLTSVVRSWSSKEVNEWLKNIKLDHLLHATVKNDLDGFVLVHLHNLRKESPDTFFRMLKEDLGLKKLKNLFTFADGLQELLAKAAKTI